MVCQRALASSSFTYGCVVGFEVTLKFSGITSLDEFPRLIIRLGSTELKLDRPSLLASHFPRSNKGFFEDPRPMS